MLSSEPREFESGPEILAIPYQAYENRGWWERAGGISEKLGFLHKPLISYFPLDFDDAQFLHDLLLVWRPATWDGCDVRFGSRAVHSSGKETCIEKSAGMVIEDLGVPRCRPE